jgi:antitoxin component YwqK of YwqJK toxin-antitoxin module
MKNQSEYLTSHKKYERNENILLILMLIGCLLGLSSWVFDLDMKTTTWLKVAGTLWMVGLMYCYGFASGWEAKESALYDGEGLEGNGDISEKDLEQYGEITQFEGKSFTGVCVDYFKEDTSDPFSHYKYEKHYKDGKQDGLYTIWYHIGDKASETPYANGEINGIRRCWYANNQKMYEVKYKSGVRDGLHVEWYFANGEKWFEEYYKNDVRDGISTHYHRNGQKKSEKYFKDGIENGLRKEWDEDGKLIFQINYVDGVEEIK